MATAIDTLPGETVALIRLRSKSIASRLGVYPGDHEDIEQELLIHVWQQSSRYVPERGAVTVFLGNVVDHRIGHLLEAAGAQKRGGGVRPLSLDRTVHTVHGQAVRLIDLLSEQDHPWSGGAVPADECSDLRIDLLRVLCGLPERLVGLCRRLAQATVAEIARETGVSRSSLYVTLAEIRTVFRTAGLDAYLGPSRTDFARFR